MEDKINLLTDIVYDFSLLLQDLCIKYREINTDELRNKLNLIIDKVQKSERM